MLRSLIHFASILLAHIPTTTLVHVHTVHTFSSLIIPLRTKRPLDPERYAQPPRSNCFGLVEPPPLENRCTLRHDFSWLCYSLLRTVLLEGRNIRTELPSGPIDFSILFFSGVVRSKGKHRFAGSFHAIRQWAANDSLTIRNRESFMKIF